MRYFVKILLGGVILSYALTTIAMEDFSMDLKKKVDTPQPLKFKVNSETELVEDAEGSDLIQEYRSAVRNLHASYESVRDDTQEELKELEAALSKMSKDSDEYFATEIYRNKLVSKISRSQKKASDVSDQEIFFNRVLAEIYKSAPYTYSNSVCNIPVSHYEILSKTKFKEMDKLDFFAFINLINFK